MLKKCSLLASIFLLVPFSNSPRAATVAKKATGYLFPGYRRRPGHAIRFSLRTIHAGGYGISRQSGRAARGSERSRHHARRGPNHGGVEAGECKRPRLRGDHAFSRGSRWKRGGTRPSHSHSPFCRPRPLHRGDAAGPRCAFLSYLPSVACKCSMAKPGDRIPVEGLDVQVVSSAGELIKEPMAGAPGAGAPNPFCRDAKLKDRTPRRKILNRWESWCATAVSDWSIWAT